MYTEQSVSLKSDFYSRYGQTKGELYFEKVGLPCVVLGSDTHSIMFSLKCGVRAYGRAYGDVLKVLDSESNICDVHFVTNGKGAQILYKADMPDVKGMKETALYTVNKLLINIGSTGRVAKENSNVVICDEYAPQGWCAVKQYDEIKTVPLPLSDHNVLLIRGRKNRLSGNNDALMRFYSGENERIKIARTALKECRTDSFFDMINESQKSIERLLLPPREMISVVRSTWGIDGVSATRICDMGVISFCKKDKTDSVIQRISNECERTLGYRTRIAVVK